MAVKGDLETGPHDTVEDTGIALGRALDEALGDCSGIRRYGHAVVPMDEACVSCAIDVSGRPYASLDCAPLPRRLMADSDSDLLEESYAWSRARRSSPCTWTIERGNDTYHMVEASFSCFARALGEAVSIDPVSRRPATKGLLRAGGDPGLRHGHLRSAAKASNTRAMRARDHVRSR